jgi:prophage regulatory protein
MTIINLKQVQIKTTMKRSSVLDYSKHGRIGFPASIKIGAKKIGWIEEEIDAWIQSRVDSGRQTLANTAREVL